MYIQTLMEFVGKPVFSGPNLMEFVGKAISPTLMEFVGKAISDQA